MKILNFTYSLLNKARDSTVRAYGRISKGDPNNKSKRRVKNIFRCIRDMSRFYTS